MHLAAFAGKFPGDGYIDARHARPPAGPWKIPVDSDVPGRINWTEQRN